MQALKMGCGFILLAIYFGLGAAVQSLTGLPVPAGIWGLVMLFISFVALRKVPESLRLACDFMIRHMPFLFLPALVSVMAYRAFLKTQGLVLLLAMIISTIIGLALAGLIFEKLVVKKRPEQETTVKETELS